MIRYLTLEERGEFTVWVQSHLRSRPAEPDAAADGGRDVR